MTGTAVRRRTPPEPRTRPAETPDPTSENPPFDVPGPPRWLRVLAAAATVAGVGLVLVGGWRTGVSWDETYHVMRMRNFLDTGWYLLDGDLLGSEPGPWEEATYVYGPATMGLLHGWVALWGVDGAAGVPASAEAYAVRHLGVGLIALAGVAATAGIARVVLRSWPWALVAAGVLLTIPVWTGHAMFNVKDVPVATGFTLVTLGLALLVTDGTRPVLRQSGAVATLVAGVVLAVGTRPGIWAGLALSIGVAGLVLLARREWGRVALGVAALAVAYVVLLGLYPAAFATPVEALVGGALESSRYGGATGYWWYLPLFVLVEMPTLYLLLGLGASVAVVSRLAGARTAATVGGARLVVVLVLLQCYALPLLAIARQSNVYTGVRQMLFAAPAMAVLVTIGIALLLARRERWGSVVARLVPVGVAVAMLSPLLAQLQLFPYSYAYSSVPANLAAPVVADRTDHRVPTDYWRTSVRELAPSIPVGGWVTCSPSTVDGRAVRYSRESHENCATDPVGPLAPYDDLRSGTWDAAPTRMLAVVTDADEVARNCSRTADVRRRLYWREVTMGYVAACDLHLEPYPVGGLDHDGGGRGGESLLGGWDIHGGARGVGVRDDVAWVGFTLPDAAEGERLEITGTATGAAGMRVQVNGEPVPTRVEPGDDEDRFRATVPARVAAAYGDGRVLMGLADADPGDGVLRLLTLRAGGVS